MDVDRNWFVTVTTYGTRLPGDRRGFVSHHRPGKQRIINNLPGTLVDADHGSLLQYSKHIMKGRAIRLNLAQGHALLAQFIETTSFRRWRLWAVSIMADHFHAVVGVSGDPKPSKIRGDLKSYASRKLNRCWGIPDNGTWWTGKGSNRKLPDYAALLNAIRYTVQQEFPLIVWTHPISELELPGGLVPATHSLRVDGKKMES